MRKYRIDNGYYVVENQGLNVGIKGFWYSNNSVVQNLTVYETSLLLAPFLTIKYSLTIAKHLLNNMNTFFPDFFYFTLRGFNLDLKVNILWF